MLEEVTWATVVLLSKGREGYQVIGLVEVVWEICTTVVNFWIKISVMLHIALHVLRAGRVTET